MGEQSTEGSSALAELVGTPAGRSVVVVERGPVAAFADAVLDPSPIYRDPDAARAAGWEAIPAPPTFPIAMSHWGSFVELQPTGDALRTPRALLAGFAGEGGVLLHGEQEFEYHRPVVVGDVLAGEARIVDAYRKESKGKTMTFIVVETIWTDERTGAPVVTARSNLIHRA